MVVSCSAYGCTNRRKQGSNLTFHRVPKDPNLRSAWMQAIRRKDWIPTRNSFLCSEHFKETDFNRTYASKIARLREDVVPSIFKGFPSPSEAEKIYVSNLKKNFKIPEYDFVEKILDEHIIISRREYFLEWKKYTEKFNTDDPTEKSNCPEIKEFENRWKCKNESSEKETKSNGVPASARENDKECARGFLPGLEPERIIGASNKNGELMFLIKWKGCCEANLVRAKEANIKCPQIVIKFYEERLTWQS